MAKSRIPTSRTHARAAKKTPTRRSSGTRRPKAAGQTAATWHTAITLIEPNKILVRGYPLDELMGRISFGEAIYLLLTGDLPTAPVGRLIEALLVSSIDHGATPPSTLAACNVATTGAPLHAAAAAGVLAFGSAQGGGGSIPACFTFLDDGLALVGEWVSYDDAARRLVDQCLDSGETPPGFGHRYHTRDPRATRLLQMALEGEVEGGHIQLIRAVERALSERRTVAGERPLPINEDGAIAAICGDLGLGVEVASVLFMISRMPGIVAHAVEEQQRQHPLRSIDPTGHVYDGPNERRLPETRR